MQTAHFKCILETIDAHGPTGCSVKTIVKESGLSAVMVRTFLTTHSTLVKSVSSDNYAINDAGKHRGSVAGMVKSHQRRLVGGNVLVALVTAAIVFGLGMTTSGFF